MFRVIWGYSARFWYAILVGSTLQYFCFWNGIIHFYIMIFITWLILKFLPTSPSMPTYLFVFSMGYLSFKNFHRMYVNYGKWDLDEQTFLLPLVSRVSSLGHCLWDGLKWGEEENKLSKRQYKYKITKSPSLLDLIGYMVAPMCCVVGPFIEYQDYQNFLKEEGRFKNIPSSTMPALKNFG